jgi:hypothetical protein
MRSYNSIKSRITNASVKQTNVLSNFLQTQGLGNTVSVSGNVDLTGYALKSYVDSNINTVYALIATGPLESNGLILTNLSPQYIFNFPVNSGSIDFFSNTSGGVSTRGLQVNATGVYTVNRFDTTDQTAGQLDIGTNSGRTATINIGTGSSNKSINIGGSAGNTIISGGNALIRPSAGGTIGIGDSGTSGEIRLGRNDANATSQVINIGTGASQSGAINIGTGTTTAKNITIGTGSGGSTLLRGGSVSLASNNSGVNELFTTQTGGSLTIGGTTTGTQVLNINRPVTPAYLPSAIGATNVGYIATPASSNLTAITTSGGNLANFSLDSGVWDVLVRVRITGITASAGNFFRLSLSTNSASQSIYMNDWNADNATGSMNFLVQGRFSLSATTTIYVVGSAGGGVGATTTTNADVQALRIA